MKKVLAMFLVMVGLSVFAQKEGESKEVDEEVDTMVCSHERDGQIQQQVPIADAKNSKEPGADAKDK